MELAVLALLGIGVAIALTGCLVAVKALVWLVLLPVRLMIGLVMIPLLLVKFLFGGVLFVVVAPVVGVALLAALLALAVALVVPLVPLILVAALISLAVAGATAAIA